MQVVSFFVTSKSITVTCVCEDLRGTKIQFLITWDENRFIYFF